MAEHSTVAISNGGKCESHSDIRSDAPQSQSEAKVGRFESRDCAKMPVAQFHQMSHISTPPQKQSGGRHGIPPLKPLLPCRPTQFF